MTQPVEHGLSHDALQPPSSASRLSRVFRRNSPKPHAAAAASLSPSLRSLTRTSRCSMPTSLSRSLKRFNRSPCKPSGLSASTQSRLISTCFSHTPAKIRPRPMQPNCPADRREDRTVRRPIRRPPPGEPSSSSSSFLSLCACERTSKRLHMYSMPNSRRYSGRTHAIMPSSGGIRTGIPHD